MKFRNKSALPVGFKLRGVPYNAPPGGQVTPEVPDKLAFAVEARGLPLESIGSPSGDGAPLPPEGEEARLWFDRAQEERVRADTLAEVCSSLQAERDKEAAEVRRLGQELDEAKAQYDALLRKERTAHERAIAALRHQHETELAQATAPPAEPAQGTAPANPPKAKSR